MTDLIDAVGELLKEVLKVVLLDKTQQDTSNTNEKASQ